MQYKVNDQPKTNKDTSETGCCPRFNPADWDGQTLTFKDKPFIKLTTRSFFYMPIGIGKKMGAAMQQIRQAGAEADNFLMLSADLSPWTCGHYIAVSKPVPDANMTTLSGTFLCKVFEGPYKNAGQWFTAMQDFAKSKGKKPIKTYFWYTTCPACAKTFGKNYVVGVTQVA